MYIVYMPYSDLHLYKETSAHKQRPRKKSRAPGWKSMLFGYLNDTFYTYIFCGTYISTCNTHL